MATRILQVDSSIFGEHGQSSQLAKYLVAQIQTNVEAEVTVRDLTADPLPHLSAETIQAIMAAPEERSAEQVALVNFADTIIKELQDADILVLSAPMYNFGVPSGVKAWMDYLARAGVTFKYTPNGPQGLMDSSKIVYVISTRGGLHKDKASDSQTPFVNTFLGFLGLTDVRWIYAEGINMGDQKETALAEAKKTIVSYVNK